ALLPGVILIPRLATKVSSRSGSAKSKIRQRDASPVLPCSKSVSLFKRAPRWQPRSPTLLDELQGEAVAFTNAEIVFRAFPLRHIQVRRQSPDAVRVVGVVQRVRIRFGFRLQGKPRFFSSFDDDAFLDVACVSLGMLLPVFRQPVAY